MACSGNSFLLLVKFFFPSSRSSYSFFLVTGSQPGDNGERYNNRNETKGLLSTIYYDVMVLVFGAKNVLACYDDILQTHKNYTL